MNLKDLGLWFDVIFLHLLAGRGDLLSLNLKMKGMLRMLMMK